jgi:hypothetical protein
MDNNPTILASKLTLNKTSEAYCLHAPSEYMELLPVVTPLDTIEDVPNLCMWLHVFYTDAQQLTREYSV